ncbi:MAG: iron-sulfur cluster biosynthesis family protein [Candidatus Electrothrix sp. YB6]
MHNMLTLSAAAISVIRECIQERDTRPAVRIDVKSGSCAGPNLRLTLDGKREDDHVEEHDGIVFLVDQELLAACGGSITVDYSEPEKSCCCSDGCGGFHISGQHRFLFTERCRLEQCSGTCRCNTGL